MNDSLVSDQDLRVGILAFEQTRAKLDLGSTRIRAKWLLPYWPTAELFRIGHRYDAVLFQKAYWVDYAKTYGGMKILDLCDPDFLRWNSPCIEMASYCDYITTSTVALRDAVAQLVDTPVIHVPDRMDLTLISNGRPDIASCDRSPTAAWFGYSTNYSALDAAIPDLVCCGYKTLLVISESPNTYVVPRSANGALEIKRLMWSFDALPSYLASADVVVNYHLPFGRWRFKSNNKSQLAWALGVPVAECREDLTMFLARHNRLSEVTKRRAELESLYDIRLSVNDYKRLLAH